MPVIGEVVKVPKEFDIEWRIKDFFSLSHKDNEYYNSPSFSFAGVSWYLTVYPNGEGVGKSDGYISLYLSRDLSGSPISVKYILALKLLNGEKVQEMDSTDVFEEANDGYGYECFISRSELLERKSGLADVLTVICTLKYFESAEDAIAECSYCKNTLDAERISSHEKKCMDKPVKCPECFEIFALQNWWSHECQVSSVKDVVSLCQGYEKVLLDGSNHDLTLKVGDKEFRAHRDILKARSRVFESMLSSDMTEKHSGVIDIPDCDPQAMKLFLLYVYCGKIEMLDQSNMLGLYYIADKYEMTALKEECCSFIKKSMSLSSFCDVFQLALNHSDSSLLDSATEYFLKNVLGILRTVEWQCFMKNNSTVANELFIKSHEKKK